MMKDGRRCHIVWVQGISECLDCVDFFTCPYRVLILSLSCKVCGVRTFPSRHWRAKCRRLTTNNCNTQAPRGGRLLDVSADGQHVRSDTSHTLILTITVALSVSDFLGLCLLYTVQACPSILNNTCVEALGLCYSCPCSSRIICLLVSHTPFVVGGIQSLINSIPLCYAENRLPVTRSKP